MPQSILGRMHEVCGKFYQEEINALYPLRKSKNFPDHCLMPWEYWMFSYLTGNLPGISLDDFVSNIKKNKKVSAVLNTMVVEWAIAATWGYTKGIYKFNEELYKELIKTKVHNSIPSEVLLKIPEYSIYVETPGLQILDMEVGGFFASPLWSMSKDETHIYFMFKIVKNNSNLKIEEKHFAVKGIMISKDQNVEIIDTVGLCEKIDSPEHNFNIDLSIPISFLLYICSENNKYNSSLYMPSKNISCKKVKGNNFRLFHASSPRIHKIGEAEGEIIRKFNEQVNFSSGWKVKPHVRRAHWHGYWTGKGREEFKYNWIPPTFINNELLETA